MRQGRLLGGALAGLLALARGLLRALLLGESKGKLVVRQTKEMWPNSGYEMIPIWPKDSLILLW